MGAHRPANEGERQAILHQQRAVVYFSVDWSGQERLSRLAFADFVERIEHEQSHLGVSCYVVSEEDPGALEWFVVLKAPSIAGTGYGPVLWLSGGELLEVVEYAAAVGVDGLINRTLELWADASP